MGTLERQGANKSQTNDTLKNNIRKEIRRVTQEILDRVITNFNVCVDSACV